MAKASRSSRIDTGPVCGPQAHDAPQLPATGRAAGADRFRGDAPRGLATAGGGLPEQQVEGGGRDGPACMPQAEVADLHHAVGQDMLEAPTDTRQSVEARGSWPCTAGFAVGEGHGAIRARDDPALGDRHFAARWGEVWQGGVGVGRGLAGDVAGAGPAPWGDLLQPSGCEPFRLPQGAGDG
jgi:hypothetical protein